MVEGNRTHQCITLTCYVVFDLSDLTPNSCTTISNTGKMEPFHWLKKVQPFEMWNFQFVNRPRL